MKGKHRCSGIAEHKGREVLDWLPAIGLCFLVLKYSKFSSHPQ